MTLAMSLLPAIWMVVGPLLKVNKCISWESILTSHLVDLCFEKISLSQMILKMQCFEILTF